MLYILATDTFAHGNKTSLFKSHCSVPPERRTQSVEETEEEEGVTARAGGTRPKPHSERSASFVEFAALVAQLREQDTRWLQIAHAPICCGCYVFLFNFSQSPRTGETRLAFLWIQILYESINAVKSHRNIY